MWLLEHSARAVPPPTVPAWGCSTQWWCTGLCYQLNRICACGTPPLPVGRGPGKGCISPITCLPSASLHLAGPGGQCCVHMASEMVLRRCRPMPCLLCLHFVSWLQTGRPHFSTGAGLENLLNSTGFQDQPPPFICPSTASSCNQHWYAGLLPAALS